MGASINEDIDENENVSRNAGIHVDILAFSPHPDDAELGAAGFLWEMKKRGYSSGIVDLTEGEMSSTASAETRIAESEKAAELLGLTVRKNMNLGDSTLIDSYETRLKVADIIRELTPRVVLAPYCKDRHPDHAACSLIVKHALVYARLKRLGEPHYVDHLYYYVLNTPFDPSFIVDITESFDKKVEVLTCYQSQFQSGFPHLRDYIPHVTAKALYYGSLINVEYGEPFLVEGFLRICDPVNL